MNNQQYFFAIAQYKKAIELDDKLSDADYGLGLTYYNLKDKTSARQQYDKLKLSDSGLATRFLEWINKTA